MDIMLENLNGIINIADDIIEYGRDSSTHDSNLLALMHRAREYGLMFNKCGISGEEIPFFGLIYSKSGKKNRSRKNSGDR